MQLDLNSDLKSLLLDFAESVKYNNKYNKLDQFEPYQFQKDFCNDGSSFRQRAFCAGNRCGKTEIGAYEMACHLTGLYPDWWEGYRVDDSGHTFIAVGITLQSTADILQSKLFGVSDVRNIEEMGTGFIPRDCIVFEPMGKDGNRITECSIRHVSGGTNVLKFHSAADEKKIMGKTLKGVWIDESDKTQCGPLYAQCVTRVMTTDGFVIQTFTPENGLDDVVKKFIDADEKGSERLKLHIASMYDAHVNVGGHITDDMIEEIKAGCPENQWECRINGIPSAGTGQVFPFEDSKISITDTPLKLHWRTLAAVDFGSTTDPSVIVKGSYDPDEDKYYLWSETVLGANKSDAPEVREPSEMAKCIKNSDTPSILVIVPHDAGLHSKASEAKGKQLIEYGVNVFRQSFRNPVQTDLEFKQLGAQRQSYNSIEVGLANMRKLFYEGRLKVDRSMATFFKENRSYFYIDNGKPVDRDNHVIDASRYCIMSLMGGLGSTLESAMNPEEPQFRSSDSNNLTF